MTECSCVVLRGVEALAVKSKACRGLAMKKEEEEERARSWGRGLAGRDDSPLLPGWLRRVASGDH